MRVNFKKQKYVIEEKGLFKWKTKKDFSLVKQLLLYLFKYEKYNKSIEWAIPKIKFNIADYYNELFISCNNKCEQYLSLYNFLKPFEEETLEYVDKSLIFNNETNSFDIVNEPYSKVSLENENCLPYWTIDNFEQILNKLKQIKDVYNDKIFVGEEEFNSLSSYQQWRNEHSHYKILNYDESFIFGQRSCHVTYEVLYKGLDKYFYDDEHYSNICYAISILNNLIEWLKIENNKII